MFSRNSLKGLLAFLAVGGLLVAFTAGGRLLDLIGVAGVQQTRSVDQRFAECGSVVDVAPPAADLASIVSGQPAGTCFSLAAGTYRFHDVVPKDGMVFVGQSTNGVVVDGNGFENAFHGTADSVAIGRMTFANFNASGGTSRQEQAPIRGTAQLWASNRGQMATNWLIESVVSYGGYASGIFVGENWTVRGSTFHTNGVTGIGGDDFVGGLFEQNVIYGNGVLQASGALVNGGGIKFTQAGTPSNPVIVRNNEIYDNERIGVWCDIGCDGMHILDNNIHDHVSRGVMYELSSTLLVSGNTIVRSNTWTNFLGDFNAGAITVGESRSAVIENNVVDTALAGVTIRQTHRPTSGEGFLANYRYVNYITSDITVRNNQFIGVSNMGISTGATGVGEITRPETITFSGNSYDNAGSIQFWWNNGERQTFSQWQAAGRDLAGVTPRTTVTEPVTPAPAPTAATTETPGSTVSTAGRPTPVSVPFRMNTGGSQLTDSAGLAWQSDAYFIGGQVADHAAGVDIQRTTSDDLYREERWGLSGYEIPIAPGTYRVVLHHAEVYEGCQEVGCRRFSVTVEGVEVADDLDVFGSVGGYTALSVETVRAVEDGSLSIGFSSSSQEPQISAIEVFSARQTSDSGESSSTTTQTVKPVRGPYGTSPATTVPGATTVGGSGGDGGDSEPSSDASGNQDEAAGSGAGTQSAVDTDLQDGTAAAGVDDAVDAPGGGATSSDPDTAVPGTADDGAETDAGEPDQLALVEISDRQPGGAPVGLVWLGIGASMLLAGSLGVRQLLRRHP